jgi:RNA polymerase sigma factor, sigma-70 family
MTRQEITQFYQKHHGRLYNIAWRILRDADEAEEAMQDTILRYVSAEREFDSQEQVSAWLARTCIHNAIDRLRKRRRRDEFLKEYALDGEEEATPVDAANDERPSIDRIRSAMDALPEPYRLILNLVLIEGLDYAEIAGMTDRKETTLRSLYSRGRCKLMKLLNEKI